MVSIFGGAMSFALLSAFWLIRERVRVTSTNQNLKSALADLRVSNDRNAALVTTSDQRIIVWNGEEENPSVLGNLPPSTGAPENKEQFLNFRNWVDPDHFSVFDSQVRNLRINATTFDALLRSKGGGLLEVTGRTSGNHAYIKMRDLVGLREEHAQLQSDFEKLSNSFQKIESLLDKLPMPFWLKDQNGKLVWVNHSYAGALEIENSKDVVKSNLDLFDTDERAKIQKNLDEDALFQKLIPATVAGDRKKLEVFSIASESGSAGMAIDKSDVDDAVRTLEESNESHSRMLDQLATAVAIFDRSQKLIFYNSGFQHLWKLEAPFLDSRPSNEEVLNAMREGKLLPEHPDWRKWLDGQMTIYTAIEPTEEWWHLLDGQTIRVVSSPRNQGGSTWIFENVTERLALESNLNALMRVQGETLDHLNEAVAVFGSNGQLKLFNPALEALWQGIGITVQEDLHIASIIESWQPITNNRGDLEAILGRITGFDDIRDEIEGRMKLEDGRTLQYSLVPLPEGQSMLTLADITANVDFEKALRERAEALEASDQLKSKFIQHVSYELRAPLTNIAGFGELLTSGVTGAMNEKQSEYVSHINLSASVLRAIVDDILDLASIDAGTMVLEYEPIDFAAIANQAFEDLEDAINARHLKTFVNIDESSQTIIADSIRLPQVIRNLLSNAINFSPDHGAIILSAERKDEYHEIRIEDQGPGIPENELRIIFERFETRAADGNQRGAGLGLSIVRSFVTMHGGEVMVEKTSDAGTCFLCRIPVKPHSSNQTDSEPDGVASAA
ncbi:MAG: ATP-binding protein [Pseudomonadota bacterium]